MLKNLKHKSFIMYALFGIINTAAGATAMFVLYNVVHASFWVSSISNYIVGGTLSFLLNKYFTFKNTTHSAKQVFRYIAVVTVSYMISYSTALYVIPRIMPYLVKLPTKRLQGNSALILGMGLYPIFNYLGMKLFVFKDKDSTALTEQEPKEIE